MLRVPHKTIRISSNMGCNLVNINPGFPLIKSLRLDTILGEQAATTTDLKSFVPAKGGSLAPCGKGRELS